ncbi:MAG: ABC transporter substrate-binding protein [Blautia wexlerae]
MSAIELGYFDDENIDVQLTEFSDGPTIIQAMESGSIDVGYIGQGSPQTLHQR